jgi:hypothetical protein
MRAYDADLFKANHLTKLIAPMISHLIDAVKGLIE